MGYTCVFPKVIKANDELAGRFLAEIDGGILIVRGAATTGRHLSIGLIAVYIILFMRELTRDHLPIICN
jgi:hypothetical protein